MIAVAPSSYCCKGQLTSVAGRRVFLTALQPWHIRSTSTPVLMITGQPCSAAAADCSNSPAQIHFMLCARTDVLTNVCMPRIRLLLGCCGLTADRKTSTQQVFDSDMLVDIAACMYQLLLHLSYMCASAHCIVACLYLHSEKCNHHLIRLEHFGLHVTQCDVSSHESAQHGCVHSQASSD